MICTYRLKNKTINDSQNIATKAENLPESFLRVDALLPKWREHSMLWIHNNSMQHPNFRNISIEKQRKQFTTLSAYISIDFCRLKIMNIEIWISRILRAWTKSRGLCVRVFDRVSRVFVTFKVAQLLGKFSLKDVSDLLRYILFFDLLQDIFQLRIPYVNQHVSVSAMFHSHRHILILTTVIMLDSFLLRASRNDVIVELTPLSQNRWNKIFQRVVTTRQYNI